MRGRRRGEEGKEKEEEYEEEEEEEEEKGEEEEETRDGDREMRKDGEGRRGKGEGSQREKNYFSVFWLRSDRKARGSNSSAMYCQFLYRLSCFRHLILPVTPLLFLLSFLFYT